MSADQPDQALVPRFHQHHILVYVSELLIRKGGPPGAGDTLVRRHCACSVGDQRSTHAELRYRSPADSVVSCARFPRAVRAAVRQPRMPFLSDEQRRSSDIHLQDLGLQDHRRTLPTPILHRSTQPKMVRAPFVRNIETVQDRSMVCKIPIVLKILFNTRPVKGVSIDR